MLRSLTNTDRDLIETVKEIAHPLQEGDLHGYDPLLDLVGDARIVLLGEASHGTHEFYRERARITTRLIQELGFSFVAVEGDWPDCYRVHRYICGGEGTARDALDGFSVFPTWMWGNLDTLHFIEWLRRYNASLPEGKHKVGFYGLDLYGLYGAMHMVIDYLDRVDPETAHLARRRYACFEPFSTKDRYAYSVGLGIAESCEQEAVAMLQDLLQSRERYMQLSPDDQYFYAVQSAAAARDGERYYRSMYRSDESSWNLRDGHMMSTLNALLDHFGPHARAVVWAHNTHIGDFRATADADGMVNIGQLVRERHPGQSVAIGFGTYEGSVTAATEWGEPPRYMEVPRARSGSYDFSFHQAETERSSTSTGRSLKPDLQAHGGPAGRSLRPAGRSLRPAGRSLTPAGRSLTPAGRFLLLLQPLREEGRADAWNEWRGQRAIGVVYHPEYERGNYVPTRLAERYDAYIHIDRTRAVKPLNGEPTWAPKVMDETYPSGY